MHTSPTQAAVDATMVANTLAFCLLTAALIGSALIGLVVWYLRRSERK